MLKQLQEAKLKEEARLKRLEEQSKKDSKKSKSKKSNNPDNVNNKEKNSTGQKSKESESGRRELKEGGKPGPIVTIKRVMEGGSKEPTVTITLKGSTPDKDKLLYTLINGQSESGKCPLTFQ